MREPGGVGNARRLVYLVCFGGDAYREMAELCIDSLRTWGRYEGDILVFTDGSFRAAGQGVGVVEVGRLGSQSQVKSFKPYAARFIQGEDYEQVALIDADMVAVDDVNGLLCASGRTIVGTSEYPFNSMLSESCGGGMLCLEERPRASRRWGVNTGFLSVAGPHLNETMGRWYDEMERDAGRGNQWADQPYFNVLVLRGALTFEPLPRYAIDAPVMYRWFNGEFRLRRSTRLLHLCGESREHSLSLMRQVVGAMRTGALVAGATVATGTIPRE
jgi:hypothetical protein